MKQTIHYLTMMLLFLVASSAMAQQTITGKVTSDKGDESLPGVNVVVKGTTTGTVTDIEGNYKIIVPEGGRALEFTFIGYTSKTVDIGSQTVINVKLSEETKQLDEVVVTGLATSVKRANLANAVTTISAQQLVGTTRPVTLDAAMQGKIVGANIVQNSGAPGGGISVQLRGVSTITGSSEPLYIIDGVYVNNSQFENGRGSSAFTGAGGSNQGGSTNRISDINPADIESIEILKGSSAAAIYGTRANAGVIIITTKRGKAGKTRFSFGQDIGFSSAIRLLGSEGWTENKIRQFYSDSTLIEEEVALWKKATAEGKIYDYEKEVFGNTGVIKNTRLSISGGNEKTKFYVNGTWNDETGIVKNTGFNRASLRANIDHKISKFMDIGVSSNYINSSNDRGFTNNDNNGISYTYNLAYVPNYHYLFPSGGVFPDSRNTSDNPLAVVAKGVNHEETNRFIQAVKSNFNFIDNTTTSLRLAISGGVDYVNTQNELHLPADMQSQRSFANPGATRNSTAKSLNTNLQAFLVFNKQLNKLNLTSQVGVVRLTTNNDFSFVQGEGLPAGQKNPSLGKVQSIAQTWQRWQDVGIVAQQEANFDDKVIGTVGIRFDKSSLNGDHTAFYAFPKASLATNITKFDFWTLDKVNLFKLRAAYGQTGGVPNWGAAFTPMVSGSYSGRLALRPFAILGNENVKPERAAELELGADFAFLDNKVTLEATWYQKDVKDLLLSYVLAPSSGYTSIGTYPVGDLRNRGVELALGVTPVKTENFSWNTTLMYWHNRSIVTRSVIPVTAIGPGFGNTYGRNRFEKGESPTRWFGTPTVDSKLTRYEESQPTFQMSWANNIKFLKNFELSFLFHWKQGGYNSTLTENLKDAGGTSVDWSKPSGKKDDQGNDIPLGKVRGESSSARDFLQDASYLRLREVALYYTVPSSALSFLKRIENVRVGVSGNNVLTFTPYRGGYDPEVSNFGSRPVGGNVDLAPFPNTRRLFFHLSVDF